MKIDASLVESYLSNLPVNLTPQEVQDMTKTIINALNGLSYEEGKQVFKVPMLAHSALTKLVGVKMSIDNAVLYFGENTQLGDLVIESLAGGDIYNLEIVVNYHAESVQPYIAKQIFLQEAREDLFVVGLDIRLNKDYKFKEISPFRLFLEVNDDDAVNSSSFLLESRFSTFYWKEDNSLFHIPCIDVTASLTNPNFILHKAQLPYAEENTAELEYYVRILPRSIYGNIISFDRKSVRFYGSRALIEKIDSIKFILNRRVVCAAKSLDCEIVEEEDFLFMHGLPVGIGSSEAFERILSKIDPLAALVQKNNPISHFRVF